MKTRLTTLLPVALCLILSSCGADGLKTIDIARGLRTEADTLGLEALAGDVRAIELKCDSLYDIRIFGAHDGRLYGRSADNVSDGQDGAPGSTSASPASSTTRSTTRS